MSKIINLAVDYKVDRSLPENADTPSDVENTAMWIVQVVNVGYKDGLNNDKRRIWTAIQEQLNINVKANDPLLKVNEYELLFLRQAFEKALIPPNISNAVTKVEDAILNATVDTKEDSLSNSKI